MKVLRDCGVAILIGLIGALAYSTLRAQQSEGITCSGGYCMLKQEDLLRLVQWSQLCHWPGEE